MLELFCLELTICTVHTIIQAGEQRGAAMTVTQRFGSTAGLPKERVDCNSKLTNKDWMQIMSLPWGENNQQQGIIALFFARNRNRPLAPRDVGDPTDLRKINAFLRKHGVPFRVRMIPSNLPQFRRRSGSGRFWGEERECRLCRLVGEPVIYPTKP